MTIEAQKQFVFMNFLLNSAPHNVISNFGPNFKLFLSGDVADALYYVIEGNIKLDAVSSTGREGVVAMLSPSDFFGEGCLLGHAERTSNATTVTANRVNRLDKVVFARTLLAEPTLSAYFLGRILERKVELEVELADQLLDSSEKLLARALLRLARVRSDGSVDAAVGKISQETLAEMIGTTRARVSFFMNQFRRTGLVSYKGHLVVHTALVKRYLNE